MSIKGIGWASEARVGDPVLKLLLIVLAGYANTDNQTWHCQEKISFDTEIPVRSLRRRMHELVEMGLIRMEERRREDGTKTSSMITVLMHPPANLAAGSIGQNDGLPPANKVAGQGIEKNLKKDMYSEDFEGVWSLAASLGAPRTKNTSKQKAWGIYRMLNSDRQAMVRAAIPAFAAAMRAENRPPDKIKHLQFWLSDGMYETASAPAGSPGAVPTNRFWEYATEKQWANVLLAWSANWQWSGSWGPEPGKPGCHVPPDLLDRFDLKYRGHLFSPEEKAAKKARVSQSRDGGSAAQPDV